MNGSNLQVFVAVYLPSPPAAGGHFSPGPGLVHSCSSKRNFLKVACKWQGACELGLAPLHFGSGHVSALCRDRHFLSLFRMLFRGPRFMDEAPPGMLGMPGLAASCKLLVCLCSQSLGWFMRVKPQNCLASSKQSLVGSCTMYCPPTDVLEAAESSLWIQALDAASPHQFSGSSYIKKQCCVVVSAQGACAASPRRHPAFVIPDFCPSPW